jgi:hypothetical protein
MTKAPWTYEVPAAGADAAGLEEYVVVDSGGEPVGKVVTVLERAGEVFLAVGRAAPPVRHDIRAVPWREVAEVDHDTLVVRLAGSAPALDRALELDPGKGVEEADAEARRVVQVPGGAPPAAAPSSGPVDRLAYGLALALGTAGLLVLLGLVAVAGRTDVAFGWEFALFLVPAALFAASLVTIYRVWRRPYESRRRRAR